MLKHYCFNRVCVWLKIKKITKKHCLVRGIYNKEIVYMIKNFFVQSYGLSSSKELLLISVLVVAFLLLFIVSKFIGDWDITSRLTSNI